MPDSAALETLVHAIGPNGFGLEPQRGLFLFARPHSGLTAWTSLCGWQPWQHHAAAWEAAGHPRIDTPGGTWPWVLALPGKSRDETLATFATAHDLLENDGVLVAALANDSGAARFEKELAAAAGAVESIQKNKCRAFLARRDHEWDAAKLAAWRALAAPTPIPDSPFHTVPGVFSAGRVDAGSALLAAHLPPDLHGRVADLGAGWGFLANAVCARCPRVTAIDLYEADARALDLARHNPTTHGGPALRFHWHDVTTGIPEPGAFDAVVMNPPFHEGQRTDVSLGGAFLAAAAKALRPGGRLLMVANRQLPYEEVLIHLGLPPRTLAQDATYKILAATRTR
jgi:16S rRNA (guanine1207-N2)-methyltransferase